MKMLVTGGAGFIGSLLCERLIKDNNQVVCIDDMSAGKIENLKEIIDNENFKFIKLNVNKLDSLIEIMRSENIEKVYHLAANSSISDGTKDTSIDFQQTLQSTFSVLEGMRVVGIKNLFFSSTSAVYGDKNNQPMTENMGELFPINYYGGAKLASEAYISAFTKMNEMNTMIFRFANVIGPHLTHGVIFDFIKKLEANPKELQILGDGQQTKPYIYALDLIDAICEKTKNIPSGISVYNCGVESCSSVNEIADIVCKKLGLSDVKYKYTGQKIGWAGDVPNYQFDISKIKSAGWRAKYTSNEAVEKTVEDWIARQEKDKQEDENNIKI